MYMRARIFFNNPFEFVYAIQVKKKCSFVFPFAKEESTFVFLVKLAKSMHSPSFRKEVLFLF